MLWEVGMGRDTSLGWEAKMHFKLHGFGGKFLHFLAALCPASRDDIVPLHRRIGFRFLHQD